MTTIEQLNTLLEGAFEDFFGGALIEAEKALGEKTEKDEA